MEWRGGFPCWFLRGDDERLRAAILACQPRNVHVPYAFRAFVGDQCCGTFETLWAAKSQIEAELEVR